LCANPALVLAVVNTAAERLEKPELRIGRLIESEELKGSGVEHADEAVAGRGH
jgi:hypothetical protein